MNTQPQLSDPILDTTSLEDKNILIVEDDPDIASLIQVNLREHFSKVVVGTDGLIGFNLAINQPWDLIILDLRLPHKDGLQLCRELRAQGVDVPILMLTSRSSEIDRVTGLESGADDYVTKPFSIIELVARVRAIFRRAEISGKGDKSASEAVLLSSPDSSIKLDQRRHKVEKNGIEIELTSKEFDLLKYFLQNPGSVFSRTQLLDDIWGYGHDGYEHTVNSHINRLRAKIEEDPTRPRRITTVWGVGYQLT